MENQEQIVRYIKSQDRISIPDLQQKFSADYLTISQIIKELVENETIHYESGVTYLVNRTEEKRTGEERPDGLTYMEQRRREILRKLSFSDNDDDDDDDDDDDAIDNIFSALTEEEETPSPLLAVKETLEKGILVKEENGDFYTNTCTKFFGIPVRFRLFLRNDVAYLTDDGLAVTELEKYAPYSEEIRQKISKIALHFGILTDGKQLSIPINDPNLAYFGVLRLYAAMEQVVALRETVPAAQRPEEPKTEELPSEEPKTEERREVAPVREEPSPQAEQREESLKFLAGTEKGKPVYVDLAQTNGILICGDSGTGKSTLLHAMICDLIGKYSPEEVCFILCDPKGSEFSVYRGEPHVLGCVWATEDVEEALNWCMREMEKRYGLFCQRSQEGIPTYKIAEYNQSQPSGKRLPHIVVVIDEYAPYMAEKSFPDRIQRVSQKAQAAGIHIVMATQKTNILVVTGYLRVEFPVRISFRQIDQGKSFLALGTGGAEKLDNGEFLMMPRVGKTPQKLLGTALKMEELHTIVDAATQKYSSCQPLILAGPLPEETEETEDVGHPSVDLDALDESLKDIIEDAAAFSEALPEETKRKALSIVVKDGEVSLHKIRVTCGLRIDELARVLEWMESMGYISPDGEGGRKVFLTRAEFEARFGPLD